jgi:3-deoxy-D-manno-octulosonic-acid transferase
MFYVFNILLLPFYPLLLGYTLWRRYVKGRSAASLRGQWGSVPRDAIESLRGGKPVIWLHAVSVGETMAARPVAKALKAALPGCRIGLSVTTDTGFDTAQGAKKAGEVDAVWYFSLDLPPLCGRALRSVQPDVFLVMETELWPNFLHLARHQGTKTVLVNGRVSDRMQRNVPKLKPFWRWVFSNLDGALLRSPTDAERFQKLTRQLGAAPREIIITGDVKLDAASPADSEVLRHTAREKWRGIFGVGQGDLLWVAGSTHPGEEEMILRAFASLKEEFPSLRLVLAPRHIERAGAVEKLIARDFSVARRSKNQAPPGAIGLLDTVGELAELYAAADITFVGGSLIERGGHNMLEPVLRGVPVVFGPFVMNFRDAAALVESSETGTRVADENQLREAIRRWLSHPEKRQSVPQLAADALAPHRGATTRVAEFVAHL